MRGDPTTVVNRLSRFVMAVSRLRTSKKGAPTQTIPGRGAEEVVSGTAAHVQGDLEDLGEIRRGRWRCEQILRTFPRALLKRGPVRAYAGFSSGDHSNALAERGEIYDFVQEHGITGFATIAGDRHSFWAGLASKSLPPRQFQPVGIDCLHYRDRSSAPGLVEAYEHRFPKVHPLRPLFSGPSSGRHRTATLS